MPKSSIVLDYYDSVIDEDDLLLLEGPHWLNDSLMGFYMDYLENEAYSNFECCFIGPEVTQCLKLSPDLNTILDALEFKYQPYAVMTLNDCNYTDSPGGSHWSLLVFCREELKFYHLDSLEGTNRAAAKVLAKRLAEYINKDLKYEVQNLKSLQQTNSYDCGVFVLCNLDNVLRHLFKKRNLSTLPLINETKVATKREELRDLIIKLYRRELEKKSIKIKVKETKPKEILGEH